MKEYRELAESKNVQCKEMGPDAQREKLFMYAMIVLIIAVLPLIYYMVTSDTISASSTMSTRYVFPWAYAHF